MSFQQEQVGAGAVLQERKFNQADGLAELSGFH
jgi:hypothetical protein